MFSFWFVLILGVIVVLVVTVIRLRPGGPGPAMNWIPRSRRSGANERYDAHGWEKPYDADRNARPDRSPL